MKKSVMIIIVTLSTLALIIIGLLFQKAEIYQVTKYINNIIITNIRLGDQLMPTYYDAQSNLYRLEDPNQPGSSTSLIYEPNLTVDLIYDIEPYDATLASVIFYTDPYSNIAQIDSHTGRITFLTNGTETFTIKSADNSHVTAQFRLRAKEV